MAMPEVPPQPDLVTDVFPLGVVAASKSAPDLLDLTQNPEEFIEAMERLKSDDSEYYKSAIALASLRMGTSPTYKVDAYLVGRIAVYDIAYREAEERGGSLASFHPKTLNDYSREVFHHSHRSLTTRGVNLIEALAKDVGKNDLPRTTHVSPDLTEVLCDYTRRKRNGIRQQKFAKYFTEVALSISPQDTDNFWDGMVDGSGLLRHNKVRSDPAALRREKALAALQTEDLPRF